MKLLRCTGASMTNKRDYCVFIISYMRPTAQYTLDALQKYGYSGEVYIVVDDQDPTLDKYLDKYGDRILVFSKEEIAGQFDEADNFSDWRGASYPLNKLYDLAEQLGYEWFIAFGDDYIGFPYRMDGNYQAIHARNFVRDLDRLFDLMMDYYRSIPAKCIAFSQGGDFIGGLDNHIDESVNQRRKCMNTLFHSVHRKFQYPGSLNEDVNAYTWLGNMGELFLTFPLVSVAQKATQQVKGGMTDMYLEMGTYVKSFYTVLFCPGFVTVQMMYTKYRRLHHRIEWDYAVPVILREEHRKAR